ncbi:DeoR family transcriptional regulator [Bacillus altitudinis]|uniref:sugar-binding transcriptional regulator n=1 Tax=Bacillus altitudinis TaxID=293387 RepID=UPI001CFF38E3|nr:sugar-binding transcriptional regulator [Bacillus altitudinis]MDN0041237.1 sugar-binding transcriptional regulator [Bacillus aerophilus]GJI59208.1 DeoR family transcriptional regulator [Bacillus altitudinis]
MLNWEERRQLVKVAHLYYTDGWTQQEIAKKLNVSRPVISKLLQKAKDVGIVEVYIKDESIHTVELEKQLETTFQLTDAVVAPSVGTMSEMVKRAVGQAGAYYLSKNMKGAEKIGISWGTTLAELVKEYPFERRNDVKVIPLEGGMGRQAVDIHANQLAYELAKKMNGTCSYLYAPAILETEELKERLMAMQDIEAVLEEGRNVDIALIGIGNPHKGSTLKTVGYLKEEDLSGLRQSGAVGDIGFRFFDGEGKPVQDELNQKVIGLSLEQLKSVKKVIAVVEGTHKAESILGALNGGFIQVLVTDELTAAAILKEASVQ